jgi:TRAP-type C4-dicarboxylate transport system permease small subunit
MWLKKSSIAVMIVSSVSRGLNIGGMVVLVAMMLLTVMDVLLRYFFIRPIIGSTEVTEYMMVCLALGMAWCVLTGRSIKMDLIVGRFPSRAQGVIDSITDAIGLVVLICLTWQNFREAITAQRTQVTSLILTIPSYPAKGVLAIAFAWLCLAVLVSLIKNITKAVKR